MNENIGVCDCPVCNKEASVRASKKAKAYIHCDDCGFQGFARGFTADKLLREKMRQKAAPAQAAPEVKKHIGDADKMIKAKPAPAVQIAQPEPEKPAAPAQEKTIFDYLLG